MNLYILDSPLKIWNQASLNTAINFLIDMDEDIFIRNFHPDSSYNVVFITNLVCYVFVTDFPFRGLAEDKYKLPAYIINSKSIMTKFKAPGYGRCCMFVALAQHLNPDIDCRQNISTIIQLCRMHTECRWELVLSDTIAQNISTDTSDPQLNYSFWILLPRFGIKIH